MTENRSLFLIMIGVCAILIVGCQTESYQYSFHNLPDGTPVTFTITDLMDLEAMPLVGDEFKSWGFTVNSTPLEGCVAIRSGYPQVDEELYLLGLIAGGKCMQATRLEIEFDEPIKTISFDFIGSYGKYIIDLIDNSGDTISSHVFFCYGKVDGTVTPVSFSSSSANIQKIRLGNNLEQPFAITSIKELRIER